MNKFIVIAVVLFSAAVVAQATYSSTVLGLNPVSYYEMNETATTAGDTLIDSSTVGNDGTWGETSDTDSKPGDGVLGPRPANGWSNMSTSNKAASFDGGETRMLIGTPADTENMSYVFFMKPADGYGNDERLLITDPQNSNKFMVLYLYDSAEIALTTGTSSSDDGMTANTDLYDGDWHLIVAVRNGGGIANCELYIDGVDYDWGTNMVDTGDSHGDSDGSDQAQIGARHNSPHGWGTFNGDMDEVAIFDYALSAANAAALYEAAIPEPATLSLLALGGVAALLRKRR